MEGIRRVVVALLLVAAVVASTAEGQAAALCNVSQEGLAACKPAVTAGPSPAKPNAACCAAMARANLPCLCSYKNSSLLPYMGVDPALAMQLPSKCGLPPPPNC